MENTVSKRAVWAGRIVSALPVLFLTFDATMKLLNVAPVVEAQTRLGYPLDLAPIIGLIEIACLALYVVPRTTPLGALLLTAFLGGAVATHVRVEDPLLSHTLFPTYVGALVWLGPWLRDPRVRALFPLRSPFKKSDALAVETP